MKPYLLLLALSASACDLSSLIDLPGGKGKGGSDGDGEGESDGGGGDGGGSWPECGDSTANRFYVVHYQLLIDPVDFAAEAWDWDGDGIEDFWDEYDWAIELAMGLFGYGEFAEVVDLMVPYVEDAAQIMASSSVSPDPLVVAFAVDDDEIIDSGLIYADEDENLIDMTDLEVRFAHRDEWFYMDVYDEDLAFDDWAGWWYFDRDFFRAYADCGPMVYVFTDGEMDDLDSRIRAIGFEIESW